MTTYLEIVLDLDSTRAEVVLGIVELVYAVQVSIARQVNRLMGW